MDTSQQVTPVSDLGLPPAPAEMKLPTVVRIQRKGGRVIQNCDFYIGRECKMGGWNLEASKWANPFSLAAYGNNLEVVLSKYEHHVSQRPDLLAALPELAGKRLGCWCDPKPGRNQWCHGHVLVKLFRSHVLNEHM